MGQPSFLKKDTPSSTHRLGEVSGGSETSQYPEERIIIPLVVANERGRAQTL